MLWTFSAYLRKDSSIRGAYASYRSSYSLYISLAFSYPALQGDWEWLIGFESKYSEPISASCSFELIWNSTRHDEELGCQPSCYAWRRWYILYDSKLTVLPHSASCAVQKHRALLKAVRSLPCDPRKHTIRSACDIWDPHLSRRIWNSFANIWKDDMQWALGTRLLRRYYFYSWRI